jgi:hypothetical protein
MVRTLTVLGMLLPLLARPVPSGAEATPVGDEFQVNQYTTQAQDIPQVAGLPDGGFVVVWQSKFGDGDQDAILVRRYTAAGDPAGDELQLNEFTTGNQQRPAVAVASAGNFVVVWQSCVQDGRDFGIFGRRLTAAGTTDGAEFAVSQYTTGKQIRPAIEAAFDGTFTITWASAGQDGDGDGIFGRRFPPGTTPGDEFQLNSFTTGAQYHPGVSASSNGDFVVVWDSFGQDGNGNGVIARRFTSSGAPKGDEFQVNTYVTENQYRPSVASAPGGEFVVTWSGPGAGDPGGIFAQRYDAAGVPVGGEFQVNTFTTNTQYRPAVAADPAGNFVIVWQSYTQDGYGFGVFGQQFRADGTPVGDEFQCNTYTTEEQGRPAVGMEPNGEFVVTWRSYSQDGSNFGAFVRRFAGPIATTTTSTTLPGATSTTVAGGGGTTTTTLPPTLPVALRSLIVRPDALLKVAVPGPLGLADPTTTGATLAFAGTTGGASYDLPAGCWQSVRKRGVTKAYRCKQTPCKVALVAKKGLRAICRGTTGDFGPLPENGPVSVTFEAGGTTYCGSCGGTAKGKATKLFKRTGCTAPPACS